MECNEIKRLLSNYLEDDLSDQQKTQVEQHLWICKNCAAELDALKRMISELGGLKKVPAPEDLLEGIHRHLGIQPKKREFLRRISFPLEAVGVLVSIILVVYIVNQIGVLKTEKPVELTQTKEKEKTVGALREKVIPETITSFSGAPKTEMPTSFLSGAPKAEQAYKGILPYNAVEGTTDRTIANAPSISKEKDYRESVSRGYYNKDLYLKSLAKGVTEQKITLITTNLSEDINKIKSIIKELEGEIEKEEPKNIYIKIPTKNLSILITRLKGVTKAIPTISPLQEEIVHVNIEFSEGQQ